MPLPFASVVIAGLLLAACSGPKADAPETAPTAEASAAARPTPTPAANTGRYVGRYVGVEGMFLEIRPTPDPRRYAVTMQWDLDHRGTFEARQMPLELGLDLQRDGKLERLVPSDGDATGLKYLAGKKDCLTVKPGEGYCRD